MEKITAENFVTLEALVSLLETSESTVRRDLDELEAEQKLRRVHGGAESLHYLREELTNQEKSVKNIQEKKALCQVALSLIDPYDVIFIDAGTTNELLIEQIDQLGITVVTNSIHHAARLVEQEVKTIIIGGSVKEATDASIGSFAISQIQTLNFDKAFIGMNGVDENFYTTPDPEEAQIKRTIIENAKTTYVLADSSKLGQVSFVKVADVRQANLITNASNKQLLQEIKMKTRVIEV